MRKGPVGHYILSYSQHPPLGCADYLIDGISLVHMKFYLPKVKQVNISHCKNIRKLYGLLL